MAKKASKKKSATPHFDNAAVRAAANGQWAMILSQLDGISLDLLDGSHHPCPTGKCSSTRDAFRFTDLEGSGSAICNQCGKFGDGFALRSFLTGRPFVQVRDEVARHLGLEPSRNGYGGHGSRESFDPAEHLQFLPWNELTVAYWCLSKPPIIPAAILACGGRLALYRGQWKVIALPVWGEHLDSPDPATNLPREPVGWCMYNSIPGGLLPKFAKPGAEDRSIEWVKVKLTAGSKPGIIADLARLRSCRELWKLEGPTDLLAFLSLPDLPADIAAITNANGSGELPHAWMINLFSVAKSAFTLHDADEPGQKGAIQWAGPIATKCEATCNVTLHYPVEKTHGKDLRDFLQECDSYDALTKLPHEEQVPTELPPEQPAVLEGPDNFHRLARVNLERYKRNTPNGTLRYWRNEWYKYDGYCYRQINDSELKSKIGAAVKEEYDRINVEEFAAWKAAGDDTPPPQVRNVTQGLISNVLFATSQLPECLISGSVELNTWIDCEENTRERRRYVALKNGILDVDGFLSDEPDCLKGHSSNWFSLVCLPYDFDPSAECPKWDAFIKRNLGGDLEVAALLQEWLGYLLLPNTDFQKFMFFEGEGSNGKSVFLAATEAMLGEANCTHVSLEVFGEPFMLTQTLGKLANITADCSKMDSVAEGYLKSFSSGDRMTFNRKGLPPIEASPTARLMISANERPYMADKSSGLWRRMILLPWTVTIQDHEKVRGMDKVEWWNRSGELPGIFNWALAGLHQLTQNNCFTDPAVCRAAVAGYKGEMNPARVFMNEFYMDGTKDDEVDCKSMYEHYREWIFDNGNKPLNDSHFGSEVKRAFPSVVRSRARDSSGKRRYIYTGIRLGNRKDAEEESRQQPQPQQAEAF